MLSTDSSITDRSNAIPLTIVTSETLADFLEHTDATTKNWLNANRFTAAPYSFSLVPDAAGNIASQIAAEAKGFSEFLTRANDGEKATLRLEIEKLRRGEKESLQVVIHLMDHCFALFQAAAASGQPQLIQQIGNYRNACIDATRRVGILPYEAQPGEPFDAERHEIADGSTPPTGATVGRTVAWGYTFQGVGIRRIQVALSAPESTTGDNA